MEKTKELGLIALDMSNGVGYIGQYTENYIEEKQGKITLRNFLRYVTALELGNIIYPMDASKDREELSYKEALRIFYHFHIINPDGREKIEHKISLSLDHVIERHDL